MKKLLLGLLVLLSLAVIALLVLPSLIDWNNHRGLVERRLSAYVGRDVSIEGDIELSLLPTPILTADSVSLVNGQGDSLAEIGTVDMRAGLLALLGGRLEIERLVLIDADIYLGADSVAMTPLSEDPELADSVVLSRVTIEDGRVHWRRDAGGELLLADQMFAQMTAESLAGPFSFVGSVNLLGVDMALDLTTGDLSPGGAWPISATAGLDGSDAEIGYSGLVGIDGRLQGNLDADGSDAARLLRAVWPDLALPGDLAAPFAFETRLDGTADDVNLGNIRLQIGDIRANGDIGATLEAVPSIDVEVTVNRMGLSDWTTPDGVAVPDPLTRLWRRESDLTLPRGLTLSMDGRIGAVGDGAAPMRNVRLDALLSDGVLSFSRFSAQLPGGTDIRGVGTLTAEGGPPLVDVELQVASGDVRRLLEWIGIDASEVPTTRLRAFNAGATIRGTPSDLSIPELDMMLDSTSLIGSLAWRNEDRTEVELRLDVDSLNVDSYWPDIPDDPAAALAEFRAWAVDRWPFLVTFDANLDLSAGGLAIAGTQLDDVVLDASLAQGALELRNAAISAWEGDQLSLRGSLDSVWPVDGIDAAATLVTAAPADFADRVGLEVDWPVERLDRVDAQLRAVGGSQSVDVEFSGTLAGGRLMMGGTVADPLSAPDYDIAIRLTHDDAERVANLLWPSYRPAGDLGAADLYARLLGPPESLRLEEVIGQVGEMTLGGVVNVDLAGDRPAIDAEISANALRLDDLLPTRAPDFTAPGANRWSTEPFQPIDLGALDARLRLTAGELSALGLTFDSPSLDLTLADGALSLEAMSASLFGGRLGASGSWRPGARSEIEVDVAIDDADVATALDQGFGIEGLSGTLDASITAEGAGTSPADLVSRLTGEGLIAVRDGTAEGLDLAAASDRLATLEGPLEFLDVLRGPLSNGETRFASLNAPFEVAAGSLQADEIRWRTDAGLGIGGARFDLARLLLDATLDIGFFDYPDAPPFGLRVFGPLSRLDRRLQADALQGWVAQRAADAISDRLEPEEESEAPGETAPDASDGSVTPPGGDPAGEDADNAQDDAAEDESVTVPLNQ